MTDYLEDLGIGGSIIIKWILKENLNKTCSFSRK